MNILIACEYSNTVSKEFRKFGHHVISCDILPNYESNEFHFQGDVMEILNDNWDLIIAFPPCTHLAVSGAKHFEKKRASGEQQMGIDFFMKMVNAKCDRICIENPVGIMSKIYRKPDQIINPWQFGDTYQKTTCLWLKNLPKLFHSKEPDLFNDTVTHVEKGEFIITKGGNKLPKWYSDAKKTSWKETQQIRNKTFPGIAKAMAEQWGNQPLPKIKPEIGMLLHR